MIGAVPPLAVGLAVALLLAGASLALALAHRPASTRSSTATHRSPSVRVSVARIVAAVVSTLVTMVMSRWALLALFVGALVLLWDRLLTDHLADEERARVEGIAKWLEDLRDTLRGSSVGAEEALEQVATRPPAAIEAALRTYLLRRRQGFRTEAALADLADDLAHPTSDAAVAAIRLVTTGASGAGRLHSTVQSLAEAARDEVRARERVDRTRAVYQHSMNRLVIIGAVLVLYLKVAGGDLLAPYDTPSGQVVLAVPLGLWLGCILWLRSLCGYEVRRGTRVAPVGGRS
jgi:tight adherence protein B